MSAAVAADAAGRELLEQHGLGDGVVLSQVLERAGDTEQWPRFYAQLRSSHGCRRPVRLRGRVDAVDRETGERLPVYSTEAEPDETLLKCCGNRREAVCLSCAETYRADAYQLVAAGLRGGKGVPDSVMEHPMLFVTLTAPSFGPVHTRRAGVEGRARRCRPRRKAPVCSHGVRLSCGEVHDEDDPRLGEPLCSDCFDYELAVLWNAMAPELWRRTSIQIPRELARLRGMTQKQLRARVRVSYVKVAEYQRRGALHFHLVVRLDAAQARDQAASVKPPPGDFGCELLEEAIRAAVDEVTVLSPAPEDDAGTGQRLIQWGSEFEVQPIAAGEGVDPRACAGYIAKYATKSTEAVGGLTSRIDAGDLPHLRVRGHVRAYVECAWRLGGERHLRELRLRRCAHMLGFRGHCFTKSRRYSTTFTALRRARHDYVLRRQHPRGRLDPWGRAVSDGASEELRRFRFMGLGYRTAGDAWLAELVADQEREQRRVAREELRSAPAGATGMQARRMEVGR